MNLKDLINEIDIDDMRYQVLTHGNVDLNLKGKVGDKYLSVKFESEPKNMNKEAIVIWVDKDKLKDAAYRLRPPIEEDE